MRKRSTRIDLILALLGVAMLCSQSVWARLPYEVFDQPWRLQDLWPILNDTNLAITDLGFDEHGNVWLASSAGLLFYDGYSVERVGSSAPYALQQIKSLYTDPGGFVWMGMQRRVRWYEPVNDRHRIEIHDERIGQILWMNRDDERNFYLGGERGLKIYWGDRWGAPEGRWLPNEAQAHTYFLDSQGRAFALTNRGLMKWENDRWYNVWEKAGLSVFDLPCLAMAESPRYGLLVATQGYWAFNFQDGVWRRFRLETPIDAPLLTTRDGEIVTASIIESVFSFQRWTGDRFQLASAPLKVKQPITIETLREAPDGSVWCAGTALLLRWTRLADRWTEFRNCPPPRYLDDQRRVGFSDGKRAALFDISKWEWLDESHVFIDHDHIANNDDLWTPPVDLKIDIPHRQLNMRGIEQHSGIRYVNTVAINAQGDYVICGRDRDNAMVEAIFEHGTWRITPRPELEDSLIVESAPDPIQGVWYIVLDRYARDGTGLRVFDLLWSTFDETTTYRIPHRFASAGQPKLHVDRNRNIWLTGQPVGILRYSPHDGSLWSPQQSYSDRRIEVVESRIGLWFAISPSESKPGVIASMRDGYWYEWQASLDREVIARRFSVGQIGITGRNGYYVIIPGVEKPSPVFCPLPRPGKIERLLEDSYGGVWGFVTHPQWGESVFRYAPDQIPPWTMVSVDPVNVRPDESVTFEFASVERFEALSLDWKVRQFSWRLAGLDWSGFTLNDHLTLDYRNLKPGWQTLQVRSRDSDFDIDPSYASVDFFVHSIPLQERPWFLPSVIVTLGLILTLALISLYSFSRASRYANRLASMVEARTQQLRRAEQHLLTVSEREKQRIGRDLHDGVVQDLTGIVFMGDMLLDEIQKESPRLSNHLKSILDTVEAAREQTRNLSRGLSPINLEKIGLASGLRDLAELIVQRFNLKCRFEALDDIEIKDPNVALNLYRIAQEGVHNAAKHANATEIVVRLHQTNDILFMEIEDDGVGFQLDRIDAKGMGIPIIHYRANLIRAQLEFHNRPSGGTRIVCSLRLE